MNLTKLATTALFATFSLVAIAQDTTPVLNGRMLNRMEHRFNITPQQIEQARAILAQEKPALVQMHLELDAERKAMVAASPNGVFNPTAAQAVAIKYAAANANAVVERAKLRTELYAILTPQQQQQLSQLRDRITAAFGLDDTL